MLSFQAPATDKPADAKEAEEKKEGEKKKKTHKSIDLRVVGQYVRQTPPAQLNALIEIEARQCSPRVNCLTVLQGQYAAQDRLETERINTKNSLEEYIYDTRNKLESMAEFFEPASIEVLNKSLDDTQNWLYEDGEDQPRQGKRNLHAAQHSRWLQNTPASCRACKPSAARLLHAARTSKSCRKLRLRCGTRSCTSASLRPSTLPVPRSTSTLMLPMSPRHEFACIATAC